MLTLRREQVDAFGAMLRARFELGAAARLKAAFPRQLTFGEPGEGLDAFVTRRVDEALALGIRDEQQVLRYLDHCVLMGRAFPFGADFAWARAILEDRSLHPVERLALIDEHMIFGSGRESLFP